MQKQKATYIQELSPKDKQDIKRMVKEGGGYTSIKQRYQWLTHTEIINLIQLS